VSKQLRWDMGAYSDMGTLLIEACSNLTLSEGTLVLMHVTAYLSEVVTSRSSDYGLIIKAYKSAFESINYRPRWDDDSDEHH